MSILRFEKELQCEHCFLPLPTLFFQLQIFLEGRDIDAGFCSLQRLIFLPKYFFMAQQVAV